MASPEQDALSMAEKILGHKVNEHISQHTVSEDVRPRALGLSEDTLIVLGKITGTLSPESENSLGVSMRTVLTAKFESPLMQEELDSPVGWVFLDSEEMEVLKEKLRRSIVSAADDPVESGERQSKSLRNLIGTMTELNNSWKKAGEKSQSE